jgi:hypothetical protein
MELLIINRQTTTASQEPSSSEVSESKRCLRIDPESLPGKLFKKGNSTSVTDLRWKALLKMKGQLICKKITFTQTSKSTPMIQSIAWRTAETIQAVTTLSTFKKGKRFQG